MGDGVWWRGSGRSRGAEVDVPGLHPVTACAVELLPARIDSLTRHRATIVLRRLRSRIVGLGADEVDALAHLDLDGTGAWSGLEDDRHGRIQVGSFVGRPDGWLWSESLFDLAGVAPIAPAGQRMLDEDGDARLRPDDRYLTRLTVAATARDGRLRDVHHGTVGRDGRDRPAVTLMRGLSDGRPETAGLVVGASVALRR